MEIHAFPIPRVVYLPGAKVKVRKRKLKNNYGTWDDSTNTVTIDSQQPIEVQRYTLLHEMMHALADYQHACLTSGILQSPKEDTKHE